MPLRFSPIASAGCNPRLRMFPTVIPKILASGRDIRLLQSQIMPFFIKPVSGIQIAVIETYTSGFVGHLAFLIKSSLGSNRFLALPIINYLFFPFSSFLAIAFKGPGHGHGAFRIGLRRRISCLFNRFLENSPSLASLPLKIELYAGAKRCPARSAKTLRRLSYQNRYSQRGKRKPQ